MKVCIEQTALGTQQSSTEDEEEVMESVKFFAEIFEILHYRSTIAQLKVQFQDQLRHQLKMHYYPI